MELDFKKNLSDTDRLIRVMVGLILVSLAFSQRITGGWATIALILGNAQFIEAYFAY